MVAHALLVALLWNNGGCGHWQAQRLRSKGPQRLHNPEKGTLKVYLFLYAYAMHAAGPQGIQNGARDWISAISRPNRLIALG
jgi:hypothetical protein